MICFNSLFIFCFIWVFWLRWVWLGDVLDIEVVDGEWGFLGNFEFVGWLVVE